MSTKTAMCQLGWVSLRHVWILPQNKNKQTKQRKAVECSFMVWPPGGWKSSPALLRAQEWRSKVISQPGLKRYIFSSRPRFHRVFSVNKQFLLKQQLHRQTGVPTWRSGRDGCFARRPLTTLFQSCPLTSYTAIAWEAQEVRKDAACPCLFVTVRVRQARKARSITAATACQEGSPSVVLCMDGHVDARCATEAGEWRRGSPLAGWAGRERDTPPQPSEREEVCLRLQSPRAQTLQHLLGRWSQAVQLPLIQAFPILEVVVQVLHKIGEVCKSWGEEKARSRWGLKITFCFKDSTTHLYLINISISLSQYKNKQQHLVLKNEDSGTWQKMLFIRRPLWFYQWPNTQ